MSFVPTRPPREVWVNLGGHPPGPPAGGSALCTPAFSTLLGLDFLDPLVADDAVVLEDTEPAAVDGVL